MAAASVTDSGGGTSAGSYALALLAIAALVLLLGYAYVRHMRHRRRQQLEALWREQDAAWEAALRNAEPGLASVAPEPSAQRLRQINAA